MGIHLILKSVTPNTVQVYYYFCSYIEKLTFSRYYGYLIISVDCEWGDWSNGTCSKTCGSGEMTKTRNKTIVEDHGGSCSGQSTSTETCNTINCPGILSFRELNINWGHQKLIFDNVVVDCQWGSWSSASCTKTCGTGELNKTRSKTIVEAHGGNCSGQPTSTETCNTNACPLGISFV